MAMCTPARPSSSGRHRASGAQVASQLLSQKRPRPTQAAVSEKARERPSGPVPEIHVHVTAGSNAALQAFGLAPLCQVSPAKPGWTALPGHMLNGNGSNGFGASMANGRWAPPAALMPPRPRVVPNTRAKWIEVVEDCDLVQHGFPSMAPALEFDEGWNDLFSSASYILYELAGDAMTTMTLTHDWEWTEYPYIAEALRHLGFTELPYALATISLGPSKKKWAVGLATNGKLRQKVVKLSLAVALAADAASLQATMRNHPGFKELCEASGIFTGDVSNPPPDALMVSSEPYGPRGGKKRRRALPMPPLPPLPPPPLALMDGEVSPKRSKGDPLTPKLKPMNYKTQLCSDFQKEFACARGDSCHFAHGEEELRKPGEVKPEDFKTEEEMVNESLDREGTTPAPGPRIFLRREDLFWIELDTSEEVPKQLEGLPMEAVVLSTSCKLIQGKGLPADGILQAMLSDEVKELRFIDDADWKELPAVGAALKKGMENEECFTAVICPTRSLWAVGVGMKGKARWVAVKLALALAVALQQEEILEEPPDLSQYPLMVDLVKHAGEAKKMLN